MTTTAMVGSESRAHAVDIRQDVAKLVLRVSVAAMILLHTWAVVNGEQAIRDTLMRWNLPIGLAWTAVIFEGIAPIMVILGVYARLGAWMMTFWMVMAFLLAHIDTGHIFELAQNGVGWRVEGPFFFLACSFCVALLGAGRYGLNIGGQWND
jgi:putative oxidoreductase